MQTSHEPKVGFGPESNLGVTAISRIIFDELAGMGAIKGEAVRDSKSWRRNYTKSFAEAVPLEFDASGSVKMASLLDCFLSLARVQAGKSLTEVLAQFWNDSSLATLRLVIGERAPEPISLPDSDWSSDAQRQVDWGLAEPALLAAARKLDDLRPPAVLPALIAFAGGAELSAVPYWLRWGGEVLLLARTAGSELAALEQLARDSSGKLWIVSDTKSGIQGVDLVANPELAAAAMSQFVGSRPNGSFLFGHFGYAPALAHVRLEAVAQALTELLLRYIPSKRLQFSWLATPTDSLAVPIEFARQRRLHWVQRASMQRIVEAPWRLFGYLKPPALTEFVAASGEPLAILDSAARMQGPSYSLAKRIQRWRAHTLRSLGVLTSYQITPPARTDSVLRHKILRATYRGSARFGLHPFDSYSASVWPAALTALDSLDSQSKGNSNPGSETDWYFSSAIHGGLWRTRYEAASIWVPATALGLLLPARTERL